MAGALFLSMTHDSGTTGAAVALIHSSFDYVSDLRERLAWLYVTTLTSFTLVTVELRAQFTFC